MNNNENIFKNYGYFDKDMINKLINENHLS